MNPIDINRTKFISCEQYLRDNKSRGRTFALPQYNFSFSIIRNCFCTGVRGQKIFPLDAHNPLSFVFIESYSYPSQASHSNLAQEMLQIEEDYEILDEAAPLYPLWAESNFWHWTFEGLSKLLALESVGYKGAYIVGKETFIRESMQLLGIDEARIKTNNRNYFIKNTFISQGLAGKMLTVRQPLTSLLRESLIEASGTLTGSKRCYTRRLGKRKLENEEEMLTLLSEFDFVAIVPEKLSFKEKVRFMTNVDFSIMPHGANTTLALFQKENSYLMELFGSGYINYTNRQTIKLLNLLYFPVVEVKNGPTVEKKSS